MDLQEEPQAPTIETQLLILFPLIDQLDNDGDVAISKIELILAYYQEQPTALDKHLASLVTPIVNQIKHSILNNLTISKNKFRFLYLLTKVRGYKTIIKLLSNEVSDFEPILNYTVNVDTKDHSRWEERYILLIWLSLLSITPFDLDSIDSRLENITLVERMVKLGKLFLDIPSKEHEASALMLARILTRLLNTFCAIYKCSSREYLTSLNPLIIPTLLKIEATKEGNTTLVRKFLIKIFQRIGLSYFKPKLAKWRYLRGHRNLVDNLKTKTLIPGDKKVSLEGEVNENFEDIPEDFETIVGILLEGLKDKDTIVRWSSAKGLGRICERIPKDFCFEIVENIISLFSEDLPQSKTNAEVDLSYVSDHTWHGACLSVAELSRRGLLFPENLKQVVPALRFDVRRGSHSIGSHVRDAACYVCWSFARAYSAEDMAEFSRVLGETMVAVSLFDREVNIRRASSAAFQENVGRLGIFPHGIHIVTAADYFAVGNRSNSFLDVALDIGSFSEYQSVLINTLTSSSVTHWDKNIRELASSSLAKFTSLSPDFVAKNVLPNLTKLTLSNDIHCRHGLILAVSEILLALSLVPGGIAMIDREIYVWMFQFIPTYPKNFLATFGFELTLEALSLYITCFSKSSISEPEFKETLQIDAFFDLIKLGLERKEEQLQTRFVVCLDSFVQFLVKTGIYKGYKEKINEFLFFALEKVKGDDNIFAKRGYGLALSVFNCNVISEAEFLVVLDGLIYSSQLVENKHNDSEFRRNCIISLSTFLDFPNHITNSSLEKITNNFLRSLKDYTIDSRGDVGSWVRESALKGLSKIPMMMLNGYYEFFNREKLFEIFMLVIQQACEKIDRVRETAGTILVDLVFLDSKVWEIANFGDVILLLKGFLKQGINWLDASEVYPVMLEIMNIKEFRFNLLKGVIVSVGGLTESLVRHSSSSLVDFLSKLDPIGAIGDLDGNSLSLSKLVFLETLVNVFQENLKVDRITTPLLESLDLLFNSNSLCLNSGSEKARVGAFKFYDDLLNCLFKELEKSKDPKKISLAIKVYCGFISNTNEKYLLTLHQKCLKKLTFYLIHPFPKVRRSTAEQLYLIISTGAINTGNMDRFDEIEEILLGVDWDLSIAELKQSRNTILEIFK